MEDLFRSYWWLLFPIAFFVFGAWDRWLAYKRAQAHLDLLRTYATQGKEPPAELLKVVRADALDDAEEDFGFDDGRRGRRRRRGAYWALRTALITGAVAAGFWLASEFAAPVTDYWPFRLVAIILTCVAAGYAVVGLIFMTKHRR